MKKIIITIDGHAGSGKSSTAKELAKKLGYKYINSGVMYRAITLYIIENNINIENQNEINELLEDINLDFQYDPKTGTSHMLLNEKNVMSKLYNINIEELVGKISTYGKVREKILKLQQDIGNNGGIVVDGRDTGTKVFPNAELKIFMTANIEERAKRRFKELKENDKSVDIKKLKITMHQRDKIDQTREISPLIKAKDAIEIDNTNISFEDNVNKIFNLAHEKIQSIY
ncbi:MAG: (d)CMP kinase [Bacteroidetes bacterium]|nr:(d)CMP kinase [Bacteroidota bacterium]